MSDSKPMRDMREDDAIAEVERVCQKVEVECQRVMQEPSECQKVVQAAAQELDNLALELRGHRPEVAKQCALVIQRTVSVLARQGVPTQPLERTARDFETQGGQADEDASVTF
jgi:hypothetical protein